MIKLMGNKQFGDWHQIISTLVPCLAAAATPVLNNLAAVSHATSAEQALSCTSTPTAKLYQLAAGWVSVLQHPSISDLSLSSATEQSFGVGRKHVTR